MSASVVPSSRYIRGGSGPKLLFARDSFSPVLGFSLSLVLLLAFSPGLAQLASTCRNSHSVNIARVPREYICPCGEFSPNVPWFNVKEEEEEEVQCEMMKVSLIQVTCST